MKTIPSPFSDWLNDQLTARPAGTRLPSARIMADRFSISTRTVNRVISRFTGNGKITGIPGRGWVIGQPAADPPDLPAAPVSSAVRLAKQLEAAVTAGTFKAGDVMPQVKFISRKYRVSYNTAVEAYRRLRKKGLIIKSGRSFHVKSIGEQSGSPATRYVYFFRHGSPDFSMVFNDDYLGKAYRRLEKEVLSSGLRARYESIGSLPDLVRGWKNDSRTIPAGLIFCALGQGSFKKLTPVLRNALDNLGATAPPVLFDFQERCSSGMFPGSQTLLRSTILRSSTSRLASFAAGPGTKSVTVFMTESGTVWHYAGASLPLLRLYMEIKQQLPECSVRFVIKPKQSTSAYRTFLTGTKLPQQIRVHAGRGISLSVREEILRVCTVTAEPEKVFRAPDNKSVWIFDRDALAARAHGWAKDNNIDIPSALGLIGLEEDPRYYHLGLTYIGPDWDTIGHQMAHAVIGDIPVSKTVRGYLRTSAVHREKLTT